MHDPTIDRVRVVVRLGLGISTIGHTDDTVEVTITMTLPSGIPTTLAINHVMS